MYSLTPLYSFNNYHPILFNSLNWDFKVFVYSLIYHQFYYFDKIRGKNNIFSINHCS